MAIIDPEGLFNGDRLRRCSNVAQLHWPRLFLASDGFGRLELNYAKMLRAYPTFSPLPTEEELRGYLEEYATNFLLFVYQADGQVWGQWDTKNEFLPRHKRASDRRSPIPPENVFTAWKKAYREQIRRLPKSFVNFSESLQLGSGGGAGEGIGKGGGVGDAGSPSEDIVTPPPLSLIPLTQSQIDAGTRKERFGRLYKSHPYLGKRRQAEIAYATILDGAMDQVLIATTIDTAHTAWGVYWAGIGKTMYIPFLFDWLDDEKYLRRPPDEAGSSTASDYPYAPKYDPPPTEGDE